MLNILRTFQLPQALQFVFMFRVESPRSWRVHRTTAQNAPTRLERKLQPRGNPTTRHASRECSSTRDAASGGTEVALAPPSQREYSLNLNNVFCSVSCFVQILFLHCLHFDLNVNNISSWRIWHRIASVVYVQWIVSKMTRGWRVGDALLNKVVIFVFFCAQKVFL